MKQVVQSIRTGTTTVRELPDPIAPPGGVVVASVCSLVSAGTERYVVELAKKSLLGKARERPDHVKRVLQKMKQEGLVTTAHQVFAKLDEPMPLGYSSAGVVLECGRGVSDLKPGDRVAIAAPHAGVVVAGHNLCAKIPEGVTFDQACYASVGAIALEGVRLAKVSLGERVLVIGLGLIGQIAVCLLKAQGCKVLGTDIDPKKLELAKSLGADAVGLGSARQELAAFAGAAGVDAVVITAATQSNEPIEFAAEACRVKGRIVLVGVAGLNLPRPPFFMKELEFTVSSSMGPGRGDPSYEDKGVDYPIGHARWTAQRNMQAVLETIAEGKLPVDRLTTHRFPVERATEAYQLITSKEPVMGVVLSYPETTTPPRRRVELKSAPSSKGFGISMVGAGNFARLVMMPVLSRLGGFELRGLCSAKGLHAVFSGESMGFSFATTDLREILADDRTGAVLITTRHDLHAEMTIAALRAGKHVFVEKPLCIKPEELDAISACVDELGSKCPMLMVGFNRRFAPATEKLRAHFRGLTPLSVDFRFAPGPIPASAWPQDGDIGGGRIVGEACHAIDTCTAIIGSPPVRVFAESVGPVGGVETTDDRVFITMRHENGGLSNISYQAGGDRAGPAERIEVFGGGRTGVVEEWDQVQLWKGGDVTRASGGKDKGHAEELKRFLDACRSGGSWPIPWGDLHSVTWASFAAVQCLRDGAPVGS
ncbi:MAG: bi-domain-containing oxidoreductase [Myxococcales bacterium]|nr:bi-domain-containing oxidoreductase [Myxococcales bacterium]